MDKKEQNQNQPSANGGSSGPASPGTEPDAGKKKRLFGRKEKSNQQTGNQNVQQSTDQNASEEKKNDGEKKKSGIVFKLLMVVCLGVFLFSGYKLFEIWNGNNQIATETEDLRQYLTPKNEDPEPSEDGKEEKKEPEVFNPDWAGLQAANPNVVGWIIVPGADISYPVVQGSDNSFFLDHTYTGQPNKMGSIFMDAEVPSDLSADNTLIYGHSVDIGGMFTNLKQFADRAFFSDHPYFWLLTPAQNYKCTILSFYEGNDTGAVYTTSFGDYRDEVLESVQNESVFYRNLKTDDHNFVTLSTCNLNYGFNSDQRYVLMAMLEKYDKPIYVSEE